MAAPTQQDLYDEITTALPKLFKPVTAEQDEWLLALTGSMAVAWGDWEAGIGGGGLEVCGSGLSTWTGTGDGGSLTEGVVMEWTTNPDFGRTTRLAELDDALVQFTKDRFTDWVVGYTFSAASYEGTTTATSNSSGTFDATAVGTEALANIGAGPNPSSIKTDVLSTLTSNGWQPDKTDADGNRVPKIREWLDAFDTMLEAEFQTWLNNTLWVDNTVQGPSASGDGSGCGTSNDDGAVN